MKELITYTILIILVLTINVWIYFFADCKVIWFLPLKDLPWRCLID